MAVKTTILSTKIAELKKRSGHIVYRSIAIGENGTNVDFDPVKRVVKGYLCKWGNKNAYGEKVIKGSCAKSINERGPNSQAKYKITFLWMHDMHDPLSLFAILREDDYGLYFETLPLDDVPNADRALNQIASGTLNQFSIGFYYIWDKIEYDEADDSLVLLEIDLIEGSVVTMGADDGTYAIRSGHMTYETLHDDIDNFISSLARKDRREARELFSQQKALIVNEKRTKSKLAKRKPPMNAQKKKQLDLNYLIKKL